MFGKPDLDNAFLQLPEAAGIYFFKGIHGEVLYVGKANNLRKRVASYMRPKASDWKTQALVENSATLDFRQTNNPVDALIFEAQLIQTHQPKFNILLKGGTPFLYFLFTKSDVPELSLVRDKKLQGDYFGPFLQRSHARKIYDFLLQTFALRVCHKKIASGCLYFHIGQCSGSCKPDFDFTAYKQRLEQVKLLLKQGQGALLKELKKRIKEAENVLEYEKARTLQRQLEQVEQAGPMLASAGLASDVQMHQDSAHIWLLWPDNSAVQLFLVADGIVKSGGLWFLHDVEDVAEVAQEYVAQYYMSSVCPNSIFTNFAVDEKTAVESFLSYWHNKTHPVAIVDRIGDVPANSVMLAQTMLQQEMENFKQTPQLLANLVGSNTPIISVDCFDISHHQGHFLVGACVRFVHGKPDANGFRKFKIETVAEQNDYACLREVVSRRYSDGTQDLPDLVLIDGGKGQLNAVKDLVGITPIAALAKEEERLFCVADMRRGVKLDLHKPFALMLTALRDYTHHFAISFHRKLFKNV